MGNAYSTEIREILNKKYLNVFMLYAFVTGEIVKENNIY